MVAKIIGVLVVLVVLVGGIYFYRDVASPAITPDSIENQNYQETSSAPDTSEPLPAAGNTAQAEASIIVSDIISAAATEAEMYTIDEENFLLDDAGDLDAFGQAITVQ